MADGNRELVLCREEYEAIVQNCAANNLSTELPNRHIGHASILLKTTLNYAREYVEIFTGRTPELFFNDLVPAIHAALDRNVRIAIVTILPPTAEDVRKIEARGKPGFSLRCISQAARKNVAKVCAHFYVSDGRMYRYEKIHPLDQNFEANPRVEATASFNQPNVAGDLHGVFTDLVSFCEPTTP